MFLVYFKDIIEIREGYKTEIFAKHKLTTKEDRSFSIIYETEGEGTRSLDLRCKTVEDFKLWTSTLPVLIQKRVKNNKLVDKEVSINNISE